MNHTPRRSRDGWGRREDVKVEEEDVEVVEGGWKQRCKRGGGG